MATNKKIQFCFLFLFLILLLFSAVKAEKARIVGGAEALAGMFPYAAAITVVTEDSRYFCGGALISNQWIVTAAQCVNKANSFTIQLGSNSLKSDDPYKITLATSEYFIHPSYNPLTLDNDIGLIKLRVSIEFSDYIKPVLLPVSDMSEGWRVLTLGWGQLNDNSELASNLNWVALESLSNDECKITYGSAVTDNMICAAGNYNEGACIGDTGSPLILVLRVDQLYGISSFVSGNGCESTDPSGFTRVYPFTDWIVNLTGVALP